jgi:ankyrin repeat protein
MADTKRTTDTQSQNSVTSLDDATRAWLDKIRPLLDGSRAPGGGSPLPDRPDVLAFQELNRYPPGFFPTPAPVADVDLLTAAIKDKNAHRVSQYLSLFIINNHDLGTPDSNGDIPVILAAQINDFIITSLVIPMNADRANAAGETALIIATRFGNVKSVDLLLSRGAKPALKDNSQKSALDYAREKQKANPTNKDFAEVLRLLQEAVDKPNARNPAPKKTPPANPKTNPKPTPKRKP